MFGWLFSSRENRELTEARAERDECRADLAYIDRTNAKIRAGKHVSAAEHAECRRIQRKHGDA